MKLFTPGPIQMDPETQAIGGQQIQYFRTPQFSQIMLECMHSLINITDAPQNSRVVFLTASGTAAMEATVMNLFTERDKVLVIDGGTFGKRFAQICAIHHIPMQSLVLRPNEEFTPNMLEQYRGQGFTGMLVNVCETSNGRLYDMHSISAFCKEQGICLVTDIISTFLCDHFSMRECGASAIILSSQKGLGLQPGMSFVLLTEEVFEARVRRNDPETLYFRFTDYYPEILRGQTNYTPAIGVINQLQDRLQRIQKYGVDFYIEAVRKTATYFRERLLAKTEFTYPGYPLSNCVTPVWTAPYDARYIVDVLRDKYGIFVVPAAGELTHRMLRVGHMSAQLTLSDIDRLINTFQLVCKAMVPQ